MGIRANPEKVAALTGLDELNLFVEPEPPETLDDLFDLDGSDGGLDLLSDESGILDTTDLPAPRRRHNETGPGAQRHKSEDFDQFEHLFKQKHDELEHGTSEAIPFNGSQRIVPGAFFLLRGMMAFVAEVHDAEYKTTTVRENRRERLRLIFENGTESAMYRQSFAIRLLEDSTAREVVDADYQAILEDDVSTGWVYVLRSLSEDPQIAELENLYKVGFTKRPVEERIASATREPTYLMAPVEVVETYRTYNMRASSLEHLLHRVFAEARLNISQTGLDGRSYDVTEWFQVPLHVIREAAEMIVSGDIVNYSYDPQRRALVPG